MGWLGKILGESHYAPELMELWSKITSLRHANHELLTQLDALRSRNKTLEEALKLAEPESMYRDMRRRIVNQRRELYAQIKSRHGMPKASARREAYLAWIVEQIIISSAMAYHGEHTYEEVVKALEMTARRALVMKEEDFERETAKWYGFERKP